MARGLLRVLWVPVKILFGVLCAFIPARWVQAWEDSRNEILQEHRDVVEWETSYGR